MRPDIKFCGLTRPDDAALAAELGARYVGVIFAGGPRNLDASVAGGVLDAAGPGVQRVGVFGRASARDVANVAAIARLNVIQLHADPTTDQIEEVRAATGCAIWGALRLESHALPAEAAAFFACADSVVLDARVAGALGGTGVRLPWEELAPQLGAVRGTARLVLAGGLTHTNVRRAVEIIAPDVVDVSSGIEDVPGAKNPELMRAFASAVWA